MSGCGIVTLVVNASLKALVAALAAEGLLRVLRVRRAALRHAVWLGLAAGMLAYPLLERIVPSTAIPTFRWELPGAVKTAVADTLGVSHWTLLEVLYLAVAGLLLLRLLGGAIALERAARRGLPVDDDPAVRAGLGGARVAVLEHAAVRVPAAVGLLRPRILLPPGWRGWEPAKLRSVLAHELAHVRRRDPLVQLVAGLVPCVYWFHPLAWLVPRRISALAELAADDAALRSLPDRRAYARHLVEIAGALAGARGRMSWAAVPLVRSSELGARVAAILAPARPAAPRRGAYLVLALALASLWSAAAAVRVVATGGAPAAPRIESRP
jgi:beta-lactamase regulating signal transducer with metallopeptidase domain